MIRHGLAIIILTLLTQIGGLAWLAALTTRRFVLFFCIFYLSLSVATRYIAPATGRVALPCMDAGPARIAVLSPLFCALNRNYVTPEMKDYADALALHMHDGFSGTRTRALDAGFPFFDGFPLLPHLSHDDGQKLDLALYFTDDQGRYQLGKTRWFLGYWGYVQPRPGDPLPCPTGGTLRWDMDGLQPYLRDWQLDEARTRAALRWLAQNPRGRNFKVLIEPHLAARLGVAHPNIRFQGCRAARHDDHIHIQFQP